MKMLLELVPLPVADVDRAMAFYVGKLGFTVDVNLDRDGTRIVQLTPPGSNCSVLLSAGLPEIATMTPGSVKALHLVVADVVKTRASLVENGVEVDEVEEHPGDMKYAHFADPDGNTWLLQEMPWRAADFA